MNRFIACGLVVLFCAVCGNGLADVIYVNVNAEGDYDGSSWTDAFTSLEDALQAAQSGDQIWVAAGIYYPTNDYGLGIGDRGKHFELKNGVAVYGGFGGTEVSLTGRRWQAHNTYLSGNIGNMWDNSDNCYHVFYHDSNGLNSTAVLDGFIITGGNANSLTIPHDYGGGMYNSYSSPTIRNCTFMNCAAYGYGGAMMIEVCNVTLDNCFFYSNSIEAGGGAGIDIYGGTVTITNCGFISNSSGGHGGGIECSNCTLTIANSLFSDNDAVLDGGAFVDYNSQYTFTNCLFNGNSAQRGGGLNLFHGSGSLRNCTIYQNTSSGAGGGVWIDTTTATFANCILWGDAAGTAGKEELYSNGSVVGFRYCDVRESGGSYDWVLSGGNDLGGNIDQDPQLREPGDGDFRLSLTSPCIDAGDGDYAPELDLYGMPRCDVLTISNTGTGSPDYVDMGAYEMEYITVLNPSGDGVEIGKMCYVNWGTYLPFGTKMKIELVNGADTWLLSSAAKPQFKWTVGKWNSKTQLAYPEGDNYRVRISSLDGSYTDESSQPFSIGHVVSLSVTGAGKVLENTSQYTCIAHYNYGPDRDVTSEVKWSSTKIKGVKMGKTGLLTAAWGIGDVPCTITASYGKGKPPITGTLDIQINH